MLYTIVPLDVIYPTEIEPPTFLEEDGVIAEMRVGSDGKRRLSRIHTTDLSRYLSSKFFL